MIFFFTQSRRILAPFTAALALAALSGCGGGGASLPTNTTPIVDSFTVNGVAVAFPSTSAPIVQVPTNALTALVCTAHDPTLSPLTFTWPGFGGTVTTQSASSTASITPTTDGDTSVTCTVSNLRGNSVSRTVTLRAATNTTPTVALTAAATTVALGKTTTLTALVTGSTAATYFFSVIAGTGTVSQSATTPAQALFTAPAKAEKDTILCYVTDTQGHSSTTTITLTVQ